MSPCTRSSNPGFRNLGPMALQSVDVCSWRKALLFFHPRGRKGVNRGILSKDRPADLHDQQQDPGFFSDSQRACIAAPA